MMRTPVHLAKVFTRSLFLLACVAGLVSTARAQLPEFPLGGNPFAEKTTSPEMTVTLTSASPQPGGEAVLSVTLTLPAESYTYSMNPSFGGATRIELKKLQGLKPLGEGFTADRAPKAVHDPNFDEVLEKFAGKVTWTRKFQVTSDADPSSISVSGILDYRFCDSNRCTSFEEPFEAALTVSAPEAAAGDTRAVMKLRPSRKIGGEDPVELTFQLAAETKDTAVLLITAKMDEGWHTFSQTNENFGRPTLIQVGETHGLTPIDEGFRPSRKPTLEDPLGEGDLQENHYGEITWGRRFKIDPGVDRGDVKISGVFNYQLCREGSCLIPNKVEFALEGMIEAQQAEHQAVPPPPEGEEVEIAGTPRQSGSLGQYLIFAFFGGMILNIMPCVLPVLAIKVMSFVQQAGESRSRVFALNLTYAIGVISVFMVLASVARVPQLLNLDEALGWGEQFQSAGFNMVMATIVFAMALSLLGVYEIPVPGLAGSSAGTQQKEGLPGAFLTGVVATLLATPCSGPFLGVTFAWSVLQPVHITYLVWATMGLGMAAPYLIFGLFPGAVKFLPRPGNWMVRMKEFSGFVLLGTVVFLMYVTEEKFHIPLLVMLLGIALGLWMIANLYNLNSPAFLKTRVRLMALMLTGSIVYFGYSMTQPEQDGVSVLVMLLGVTVGVWGLSGFFKPADVRSVPTLGSVFSLLVAAGVVYAGYEMRPAKLPWEPFTEARLEQAQDEGKTVLIDFTADWCLTCKTVERTALNTKETLAVVKRHDIVPLYADYTDRSPEIKRWLERFDSRSVPLTVIFPADQPDQPILIRDVYTKSVLLEKLQQAIVAAPRSSRQASLSAPLRE